MHKNFYGYQKGNVETLYIVEYIDDPETWEKFLNVTESGYDGTIEPWELYKKRTYDNVTEALTFYMVRYIQENTYDVKLYEEVRVNGETVLEQNIEPLATTKWYLRKTINDNINRCNERLENENNLLVKENEEYRAFLKAMNAEETFQSWKKKTLKEV